MSYQFEYRETYYCTYTIQDWKQLLKNDECKQIISDTFNYFVSKKYCYILSFVIMSNHIHFVTQLIPPFSIEDLNFKFRSFTGKELLKWIEIHKPEELKNYISMRIDRKFHIWKQKPLCVEIVSQKFMDQKTDYIHMNPVYAKLVEDPIYYTWSSAGYYETGNSGQFKFLEASDDF